MFMFEENDASSYLDMENEDLVVTNLLNKYNIQISTQNSFLYNLNDDYKALIEFISELYFNEEEIPQDLQEQLNENIHFRKSLLTTVKDKMNNILWDNQTIIFKEIVTIVNLLSFGKDYKVFENYNFYNIDNLGNLFRDYEKKLIELKNTDHEKFSITFKHYVCLIEVINELCTINSIDLLRKKTINALIETLSETINIAKFNLNLEETQINALNNILGKLLFYYSHIPYISCENKDVNYLIKEFTFNFHKLCDGYILSKNTNFAGDKHTKQYYKIFLNSLSTLVCTLTYKLEKHYKKEEYEELEKYHEIIDLYNEVIEHDKKVEFKDFYEFKNYFMNNYTFIYKKDDSVKNHEDIVNNFLETKNFDGSNMQILLCLILFSNNIEEEKLKQALEILLDIPKYENDYHEFYKLNLCDIIINKLSLLNSSVIKDVLNEKIISYIETNKIASHLMSIYSKIYLSLSKYYSFYFDIKSNESTKYYYYKYLSINGKNLLENEFKNVNDTILSNLGKYSIKEMGLNLDLLEENYIQIGQNLISNYAQEFEIKTKYNINQKLSNIVTDIFTNEGLNNDSLNQHIESFISKDIFHGLTFVSVQGLCEHKCRLTDIGYDKVEIPLLEGYTLRMAYSRVYKHIFNDIFQKNKDYIKQNIINLIISYLKSIPIYFDTVTKLKNQEKLKNELEIHEENDFVLIEINFENLKDLNTKYTYENANKIFRAFAQNVNNILSTYRLLGPKLAMLTNNKTDIEDCIKRVKKIQIQYKNDIIIPDLTIAVSWGDKENIIRKSEHAMAIAQKEDSKYYEFK